MKSQKRTLVVALTKPVWEEGNQCGWWGQGVAGQGVVM